MCDWIEITIRVAHIWSNDDCNHGETLDWTKNVIVQRNLIEGVLQSQQIPHE